LYLTSDWSVIKMEVESIHNSRNTDVMDESRDDLQYNTRYYIYGRTFSLLLCY